MCNTQEERQGRTARKNRKKDTQEVLARRTCTEVCTGSARKKERQEEHKRGIRKKYKQEVQARSTSKKYKQEVHVPLHSSCA
ncbi:hypothetical protein [Paenibacillus sp. BIC5C1]|uniref:hypothetical protein n=1 Tax=Paenibacillus sp. BIC5C1 TaxID=3078263 RepID=UPI0028E45CF5|nr:hypothetical protein [Paenibacillus sp. BIC5C1]